MTNATYPSVSDRVVFITGGGSGIGAAMVGAFAANGARVAFVDIDVAASEALVKELSGARHAPLFLRCDLTDIAALRDAIAQAEKVRVRSACWSTTPPTTTGMRWMRSPRHTGTTRWR